jgi:hypothetical protein
MSAVAFRKHLYLPLVLALYAVLALLVFGVTPTAFRGLAIAGALIVLFAPAMIGRVLLRDLFASRAYLASGKASYALVAAEGFLEQLKRRPWIRHAIWTQFGIYTLSVVAMAQNNAGAALLEMGRLSEARGMLERARRARYPIPVFNLAIVAKVEGDELKSEDLAQEAARLGFADGRLDVVLNSIGTAYARLSAAG